MPLFLLGGTVLGVGRGEEVYPLQDLPAVDCVVATPEIGVSTPQAFKDWDEQYGKAAEGGSPDTGRAELTGSCGSDRMNELGQVLSAWLSTQSKAKTGKGLSGVSAVGRGRAESPLLDLVRTGIENDFEQVVFPQYPELREVKRALMSGGAFYASLSGSGSAVYGLLSNRERAKKAAAKLRKESIEARVTKTLRRRQYWARIFD